MSGQGWSIEVERRGERGIDRLDRRMRERVLQAITRLADDPSSASIRRLRNRPESRLLRVGDWRVLFEVDPARRALSIKRLLPRQHVYRR